MHLKVIYCQKNLGRHRNDFLEWRYPAEEKKLHVNFLDLEKALDILIAVYGHREFLKLCSSSPQQMNRSRISLEEIRLRCCPVFGAYL